MNVKRFVSGFMIGGVIAGISTLLTAPQSGKQTRMALKKSVQEWREQLAEVNINLVELKETFLNATKESSSILKNVVDDIKTSISNWKIEIEPHQQELQHELNEMNKTIEELEEILEKK